jgi:hypothetical protein
MCSPFDPPVGFGVAIIVALSAAALLRRGAMARVDQRGFAVGEVVRYGGGTRPPACEEGVVCSECRQPPA